MTTSIMPILGPFRGVDQLATLVYDNSASANGSCWLSIIGNARLIVINDGVGTLVPDLDAK